MSRALFPLTRASEVRQSSHEEAGALSPTRIPFGNASTCRKTGASEVAVLFEERSPVGDCISGDVDRATIAIHQVQLQS